MIEKRPDGAELMAKTGVLKASCPHCGNPIIHPSKPKVKSDE